VTSAQDFTVASGYVYAAAGTQLLKVKAASGFAVVLAENLKQVTGPALGNGQVYFFAGNPTVSVCSASVLSQEPAPTAATIASQAYALPTGLTFDGGTVYWRGSDMINAVTPGGVRRLVAETTVDVEHLQVGNNWVYWASPNHGKLMRVPTSGGTPTTIAQGQSTPVGLVLDDAKLTWINQGDGTVRRANLNGSSPATVANGMGQLKTVTQDAGMLYWANDAGEVWRCATDGSGLMKIADGQVDPDDIAVDGNWVYWLIRGQNDKVKRVAK